LLLEPSGDFLEKFLAHPALRADPVIGQVFEKSSRADAVIRISLLRVIDVAASGAFPLLHVSLLFILLLIQWKETLPPEILIFP
jgi:hypothetical protein